MKEYTLTKKEIARLEKVHRSLRDRRHADRIKAVIALAKGGVSGPDRRNPPAGREDLPPLFRPVPPRRHPGSASGCVYRG